MKRLNRKGFVEWLDKNAKLRHQEKKDLYDFRYYDIGKIYTVILEVSSGEIVVYGATDLFIFSQPRIEVSQDFLIVSQRGKVACIPLSENPSFPPFVDLLDRARFKGVKR